MKTAKMLLFVVVAVVIAGCAGKEAPYPFYTEFQPPDLREGYQQKVENLLVLFDASASMYEYTDGTAKVDVAKSTMHNLMASLPADISLDSGLRSFGPVNSSDASTPDSQLLIAMAPLNREVTGGAVQGITTGGMTPIAQPLVAGGVDLRDVQGRTAVILISDGIDNGPDDSLAAVQGLREEYGDRLCLSTILIGEDPGGQKLLEDIATTGGCGNATSARSLESREGMADFVKRVFYTKSVRADSDGDGVFDDQDRCPGTPRGTVVDVEGCPLDSDGDGVYDSLDRCPGTMQGIKVDAHGCAPRVATVDLQVEFDSNKTEIKPAYRSLLSAFGEYMEANPQATAILAGHTDNVGSARYNLNLSRQRAESVKQYLIEHFRIGSGRLVVKAYGLTKPIASNATENGRRQNRRVVAIIDRGTEQ